MNNKIQTLTSFVFMVLIVACASEETKTTDRYNLSKKYWGIEDYKNVNHQISYMDKDEKVPNYSDPAKAPIFQKIIDKNNLAVVVEDHALGLSHRSDFASGIFDQYRKLHGHYQDTDREDKYLFPLELVELEKFGLYVQIHYFDLGNQNIIQDADDPEDAHVQRIMRGNEKTLVSNFNLYLDEVKRENAFNAAALSAYINGLNEYFPMLLEKFPKANVATLEDKVEDMTKKARSQELIDALDSLSEKLKERSKLHQVEASKSTLLEE